MTTTLHTIGYYLAALLIATLPAAVLYWLLIHPFVGFWRRLGRTATLIVVATITLSLVAVVWSFKDALLAVHWGYHWAPLTLGLALYFLGAYGEIQIRKQLKFRTLAGVPELEQEAPGVLLTDGVFARSRNPRYVNLVVALLGWALILNYPALYIAVALLVPGLYLVVLLEERELRDRFGVDYEAYCSRVPRFLPRGKWIF